MQRMLARSRSFVFLDIVILSFVLCALWLIGSLPVRNPDTISAILAASGLVLLLALVMGLYRRNTVAEPRFRARCLAALVACALIVTAVPKFFSLPGMPKQNLQVAATLCLLGMVALRVMLHRFSVRTARARRIVTVLPDPALSSLLSLVDRHQVRVSPSLIETDAAGNLTDRAREYLIDRLNSEEADEIILSDAIRIDPRLERALAGHRQRGVRVSGLGRFMADEFGRLPHDDPETVRRLIIGSLHRDFAALVMKRSMDVAFSLVLLILLAPLMIIAAAIIRLTDGGPVLYRQIRVGLDQKPFTLMKFRSMRVDAEANGVARWAERRDSRITRFGAFMRVTRIDELPQLLNILRGDMSLVGPRPERPELIATLRQHIPAYDLRHLVLPGLTGWAQINYPYGASVDDAIQKTTYDLYYAAHRNCLRDGLILLETIRVVLFAEGSR